MHTEKIIEISRYALPIMLGLAFAFQLLIFILCTSYKKKAADIHNTNKELFRSIKLRYTNAVKLSIPLIDTNSNVEKYFYGKGGPFHLAYRLDRFSGFLLCTSLTATTALYVRDFVNTTKVISFIAIAVCFYIFRETLSNERQMQLTISYTTDYLDNTLRHRLTPEPLRKTNTNLNAETTDDRIIENNNELKSDKADTSKVMDISKSSSKEKSDIIEAVLQEYLA